MLRKHGAIEAYRAMRRFALGMLVGALIAAVAGAWFLSSHSAGLAVRYVPGDAAAPDWAQAGFERYRWSSVEAVRGWNGRYSGHVVARQANGRISSQGGIIDRGDRSWAKDGTWVSYAEDGNVTAVEIFTAGTIDSALTIDTEGVITVHVYEAGRLIETRVHAPIPPATVDEGR